MDPAAWGVFGVIAGAGATGSIQSIAAISERRLAARASARSVHSLVIRTRAAVEHVIETKRWDTDVIETDWAVFHESWLAHSDQLARVLSANAYYVVVNYFLVLDHAGRARSVGLAKGQNPTSEQLAACAYTERLGEVTARTLERASKTWIERRLGGTVSLPPDDEPSSDAAGQP